MNSLQQQQLSSCRLGTRARWTNVYSGTNELTLPLFPCPWVPINDIAVFFRCSRITQTRYSTTPEMGTTSPLHLFLHAAPACNLPALVPALSFSPKLKRFLRDLGITGPSGDIYPTGTRFHIPDFSLISGSPGQSFNPVPGPRYAGNLSRNPRLPLA